jgi:heat-inducible transcriptional repressor
MRVLPSDEHQSRKEKILQAVVHLYIKTGKPVGSATIVDNYRLKLSPASIRNVLADLEKEGFLTHPHTSAGRIPTDRGYRFYVDSIANIQRLAAEEERRIQEEYSRRRKEIEDLMAATSRVLSALSHCTGFVLPHKSDVERLRRVELIPISHDEILGILVSESGIVRNQSIRVNGVPDDTTIRKASRFLNEQLAGLSFGDAQRRLVSELDNFHTRQAVHADLIRALSKNLFETEVRKDLYVEGATNILKFPEFHDYESMRHFAQLVDEKEALGEVLVRGLNTAGLQVQIGSEVDPDLKDFSVVSSGYRVNGRPVGVLGILGPKRMEYERMMAIVNTVANLVNRFLEGPDGNGNFLERKE